MPAPRRWRAIRATGCAAIAALCAGLVMPPAGPAGAQPGRPRPASQPAAPRPQVLLFDWGPGAAAEAANQLRLLLDQKGRFRLALRAAAIEKLKASPAAQRARADASTFTDAGRAAEMGLQWGAADAAYRRALDALDEAVVRLYDPELVARLHLALGAVAFHQGQRTEAHDEFRRALSLWPALVPDRGYSPQVRAAFDVARGKGPPGKGPKAPPAPPIPPPPPPSAPEVGRLGALTGADAVIVIEEEAAAGHALRASLYAAARRAFVAVETRALAAGTAEAADYEALAGRVAEALDGLFPPPRVIKPPPPKTQPATQKLPPPPPPPPPWYKRWWLWATVGAVVLTSVAVPILVLRHDTVSVVFSP